MTKLYIAYGSNMDERQMAYRCPDAGVMGTGLVEGYRLLFKGAKDHAYATIEPGEDSRVPVLVWEISEMDENRLDRYEGFPRFYYKKDILMTVNGKKQNAMAYIMNEKNPLNRPSREYHGILATAYLKYGFDIGVLNWAMEKSCPKDRMVSITPEELEGLRQKFPEGCRVELLQMDAPKAPPLGTKGTVLSVDCRGNIIVNWDNGGGLYVAFGADRCRRMYGKKEIDKLFDKIQGCRFCVFEEMENWFRSELNDDLPELNIVECSGINTEIENKQIDVDFSTDCTFGENIFGFSYADFTIDYILDNEKRMYVTYARWN